MRNIIEEAFSVNLFMLRILGFLPFKNHVISFRFYSIIVYCSMTALLPILSIVYFSREDSLDLYKMSNGIFVALELAIFAFKYLPYIINAPEIIETIYIINQPVFSSNLKKRQEIMLDNCTRVYKRTATFFLCCVVSGLTTFSSLPVLLYPGTLPIEIWRPTNSSTAFVVAYCYVVLTTWHGTFISLSYDLLIVGLIYQTSCQVRILRDNLQHLNEDVEEMLGNYTFEAKDRESVKNNIIYNEIKLSTIHHQNLLSFIDQCQYYFSSGIFAQFFGSCIVICFSIFEITIVQPFSILFIFICNYIVNILVQIFLYCIFGTTLYEESQNITTSIYMGNWLEFDLKSQKALILLMERANKPMIITAGAILDLSLATFSMILRRAYSFYAVLRQYK